MNKEFKILADATLSFFNNGRQDLFAEYLSGIIKERLNTPDLDIKNTKIDDSDKKVETKPELKVAKIITVPNKPAFDNTSDLNERIDKAYLGEHFNIQPKEIKKLKLSKREQEFYDLYKLGKLKPQIEDIMDISQANFYYLKKQCKAKGWL